MQRFQNAVRSGTCSYHCSLKGWEPYIERPRWSLYTDISFGSMERSLLNYATCGIPGLPHAHVSYWNVRSTLRRPLSAWGCISVSVRFVCKRGPVLSIIDTHKIHVYIPYGICTSGRTDQKTVGTKALYELLRTYCGVSEVLST